MIRQLNSLMPRLPLKVLVRYPYFGKWGIRDTELGAYFFQEDPFNYLTRSSEKDGDLLVDMDLVRNRFMEIRTPDDVLRFYQLTHFPIEMHFCDVSYYQKGIRLLSKTPFPDWRKLKRYFIEEDIEDLIEEPMLILRWNEHLPFLECDVLHLDPQSALIRSFGVLLQFEQLCGVRQRYCERPGCHEPLGQFARIDKRFCEKNCANVARYAEKRATEEKEKEARRQRRADSHAPAR